MEQFINTLIEEETPIDQTTFNQALEAGVNDFSGADLSNLTINNLNQLTLENTKLDNTVVMGNVKSIKGSIIGLTVYGNIKKIEGDVLHCDVEGEIIDVKGVLSDIHYPNGVLRHELST